MTRQLCAELQHGGSTGTAGTSAATSHSVSGSTCSFKGYWRRFERGDGSRVHRQDGSQIVLLTLAAGQFLMTLDSSVMNVSIATVAKDVGTTVTGIQGAITAYTLVMAALMITGGKIGAIIGRKRAFAIGCVIYGCGSLTTVARAEPAGVAVRLVVPRRRRRGADPARRSWRSWPANFPAERRPAAYGLVAAAGAIAVAVGPLIGGFCTTYFSWRWVFAGEVVVVLVILLLTRRIADAPVEERPQARPGRRGAVGAAGLGLIVFGVLRSGEWGWILPQVRPALLGRALADRLARARRACSWSGCFFRWEAHRESAGQGAAHPPGHASQPPARRRPDDVLLPVPRPGRLLLRGPALPVGRPRPVRARDRCPAAAAVDHPARRRDRRSRASCPNVSPRLVVRGGALALLAGIVVLLGALDAGAGAEIVFVPMLLVGLGIGALASQLGAVTVSAVPDEQSAEVGGVQNTMTNLGASLGTALAGSILIAALTTSSFLSNITAIPAIPAEVTSQARWSSRAACRSCPTPTSRPRSKEQNVERRDERRRAGCVRDARIDGLRSALAILAHAGGRGAVPRPAHPAPTAGNDRLRSVADAEVQEDHEHPETEVRRRNGERPPPAELLEPRVAEPLDRQGPGPIPSASQTDVFSRRTRRPRERAPRSGSTAAKRIPSSRREIDFSSGRSRRWPRTMLSPRPCE